MAGSMWRMNGMAGALLLCTLLLSNEVMCSDDTPTDPPAAVAAVTDAVVPTTDGTATTAESVSLAVTAGDQSAASAAPGNTQSSVTDVGEGSNQEGGTSEPTIMTTAGGSEVAVKDSVMLVLPTVTCVDKEKIQENNAVKAVVTTPDCDATKKIIEANPAAWCKVEGCQLEIFQDGNTMLVASEEVDLDTVATVLKSAALKDQLGVTRTKAPSSSNSSVLVGILVTGLLAAAAIAVGYFKCQRRGDTKGVRLADEAYPVDPENQGNTLVSVAPLNPPPETQEKPSVNGESPEAAKTEPPPTNGHSTTKTADTEL